MSEPEQHQRGVLRVLQSKHETRAFYDKISGVYDLLAEHSEGPVRQAGLDKLALARGESVLEIGYGTGHSLVEMAKVVGPDGRYSASIFRKGCGPACERAWRRSILSTGWSCRAETLRSFRILDGSLDAVFVSFALELVDTPEIPVVLAECKRVLRPGGRIGVVAITKENEGIAGEVYEWTHQHFPNLLDCRPIFVRRALEDAGFSIRDALTMKMWVPVEIVVAEPSG